MATGWDYAEKFSELPEGAEFVSISSMIRGIWTKKGDKAVQGRSTIDITQNARVSWIKANENGWSYARPNYHAWLTEENKTRYRG